MKNLTTALLSSALSVAAAAGAFASTIPVENPSFEDSPPGYGNPLGWSLFSDSSSPTFSTNTRVVLNDGSVVSIVLGVDGSQFAAVHIDHNNVNPENSIPIVPPTGSLAGLVSSSDLGTFTPNMLYTLTVSMGLPNAFNLLNVGLALGTGAPTLSDIFQQPGQSPFAFAWINGSNLSDDVLQNKTITLNTNTFQDLVGQPINVSVILQSEFQFGRDAYFDDVRLSSSTAAPEPASMTLFVLGLALLVIRSGLIGKNALSKRLSPVRLLKQLRRSMDMCYEEAISHWGLAFFRLKAVPALAGCPSRSREHAGFPQ